MRENSPHCGPIATRQQVSYHDGSWGSVLGRWLRLAQERRSAHRYGWKRATTRSPLREFAHSSCNCMGGMPVIKVPLRRAAGIHSRRGVPAATLSRRASAGRPWPLLSVGSLGSAPAHNPIGSPLHSGSSAARFNARSSRCGSAREKTSPQSATSPRDSAAPAPP